MEVHIEKYQPFIQGLSRPILENVQAAFLKNGFPNISVIQFGTVSKVSEPPTSLKEFYLQYDWGCYSQDMTDQVS